MSVLKDTKLDPFAIRVKCSDCGEVWVKYTDGEPLSEWQRKHSHHYKWAGHKVTPDRVEFLVNEVARDARIEASRHSGPLGLILAQASDAIRELAEEVRRRPSQQPKGKGVGGG